MRKPSFLGYKDRLNRYVYKGALIEIGPYVFKVVGESELKGYAVFVVPGNSHAFEYSGARHLTEKVLNLDARIVG